MKIGLVDHHQAFCLRHHLQQFLLGKEIAGGGIGIGDDIAQAKTLMLEAIRSVDGVLQAPAPEVLVVKLADFSVHLRARWWITPPRRADALDMQDQVLAAMKTTLIAHGIDLPFPTQQILFHDQTEEADGDRRRQREGWPAGNGRRA